MAKKHLILIAGIAVIVVAAGAVVASSLFGDATQNLDGTITLVSDDAPGHGGIDFDVPAGTTFADLDSLSAVIDTTDDGCAGGSPRFQLNTASGNIFVYVDPNNACGTGVVNTGDLLASGETVDASQVGGVFYNDYDAAVASFGSLEITGIQFVVDGGWASGGEQTVIVDQIEIDGTVHDFEVTKDACKNGGWEALGFRNQGQCVSSIVSNRGGN